MGFTCNLSAPTWGPETQNAPTCGCRGDHATLRKCKGPLAACVTLDTRERMRGIAARLNPAIRPVDSSARVDPPFIAYGLRAPITPPEYRTSRCKSSLPPQTEDRWGSALQLEPKTRLNSSFHGLVPLQLWSGQTRIAQDAAIPLRRSAALLPACPWYPGSVGSVKSTQDP
jgi:hypothetical protein